MGKKWGSNEDIHIGDIFSSFGDWGSWIDYYYQVIALRGKTQVVLQAIDSERYIKARVGEDSPLYWRRECTRPLPGDFLPVENPVYVIEAQMRGKTVRITQEKVTAWVLPQKTEDGRHLLQLVGTFKRWLGSSVFTQEFPKDWEPWTPEQIKLMEEYEKATDERFSRSLKGDDDSP